MTSDTWKINIVGQAKKKNKTMKMEEFISTHFPDLPSWAVALRGLRNREGLTQAAFGEILGIKQTNISQMERGKRPIGKTVAKRIATIFMSDYRIFL
jgi:DNA-binding XRE family transcriptional regulator